MQPVKPTLTFMITQNPVSVTRHAPWMGSSRLMMTSPVDDVDDFDDLDDDVQMPRVFDDR